LFIPRRKLRRHKPDKGSIKIFVCGRGLQSARGCVNFGA
jgi:hypothetical protein